MTGLQAGAAKPRGEERVGFEGEDKRGPGRGARRHSVRLTQCRGSRVERGVGARGKGADGEGHLRRKRHLEMTGQSALPACSGPHGVVAEDGHHLGAPALPGERDRDAALLVLVDVRLRGRPDEGSVLDVAQPEGNVDPSSADQARRVRESKPDPVLSRDEISAVLLSSDRGEVSGSSAGVAELGRRPHRPDPHLGGNRSPHVELAVVDQLSVDRVPDVALAHPAAERERIGCLEHAEEELAGRGRLGIFGPAPAGAEQELTLRAGVLREQRAARRVGGARRALRVAEPAPRRIRAPSRRAKPYGREDEEGGFHAPSTAISTVTSTCGVTLTPRYDGDLISKARMSSCTQPWTLVTPAAPLSPRYRTCTARDRPCKVSPPAACPSAGSVAVGNTSSER